MNLPDNAIKPADNIAQITAKLNSQEVCREKKLHLSFFIIHMLIHIIYTNVSGEAILGLTCGLGISYLKQSYLIEKSGGYQEKVK